MVCWVSDKLYYAKIKKEYDMNKSFTVFLTNVCG